MRRPLLILIVLVLAASECAADLSAGQAGIEPGQALKSLAMDPELEMKILALDAEHLGESDVRDVLSKAPAPHVVNIHGGLVGVYLSMISFSEFLIRMGYPESSVRNPKNGAFSYSCYFDAGKIAGAIAWHYERDALRPMIVGHSQGGIQAVKVLQNLAGKSAKSIPVWNPLTGRTEKRDTILDPYTGKRRPVVDMEVSYASAVGAGGLTRILPNQWAMNNVLRSVPDSVLDFTGFRIEGDILGGDWLGIGGANAFKPNGQAAVRNVTLSFGHDHVTVPNTKHLSLNPTTRAWIWAYHPKENPDPSVAIKGKATNMLWAADVWYSIKKHWCLELQRAIRRRQGADVIGSERKEKNEGVDRPAFRHRVLGRRVASRAAD